MIRTNIYVVGGTENAIKANLGTCPRCGENHKNIKVYKFIKNVEVKDKIFKYYAICPETDEPILIDGLNYLFLAC